MKFLIKILVMLSLHSTTNAADICGSILKSGTNPQLSELMQGWQRMLWNVDEFVTVIRRSKNSGDSIEQEVIDTVIEQIGSLRDSLGVAFDQADGFLVPGSIKYIPENDYENFLAGYMSYYIMYDEVLYELLSHIGAKQWDDFVTSHFKLSTISTEAHKNFNAVKPKY